MAIRILPLYLSKFNNRKSIILISLALFAIHFILKIIGIGYNDIAMDEPFTLFYSQQSLTDILSMLDGENNPPGHFLLMHYWINWFGLDPISVRFPGMLISCFTPVILFLMGTKFFSIRTGLIAALMFIFSNFNTIFAHEARTYPFFVFLTSLSFYFYLELIVDNRKSRLWHLAVINVLLVYFHFFGFFVWFAQGLFVLLNKSSRTFVKSMIISFLLSILFYAPMIYLLLVRLGDTVDDGGTWLTDKPGIVSLYNLIWKFSNVPINAVLFIIILITTIVLLFKSKVSKGYLALIFWFFVPLFSMFILSYWMPIFLDRYLVFLSGGFYLLLAHSWERIWANTKYVNLIIFLPVILMAITTKLHVDHQRPLKLISQHVENHLKVGGSVIVSPDWIDIRLLYHLDRDAFEDYDNYESWLKEHRIYAANNLNEISGVELSGKVLFVDGGIANTEGIVLLNHIREQRGTPFDAWHAKAYNLYWFK